ncbi:TetR/AcrR family transcriptional regulator [Sphingomonas sp. 28-63-12]|uniref:TetR/AcrR family transcriptional regulator n=1 Tax=Sphingomonas sp. 28-63-12 TaxID=1970434 RepID=UPI000BCAB826|nr:MAG: hypothetical protein B7Y47_16355 [Sphingomonas sp. 28-63-12]
MMGDEKSETPRDALIATLYDMFRTLGFEGVSIGDISKRTGLGRSSLYHYFPGGKEEMAQAVARNAVDWVNAHVIAPLHVSGTRARRVAAMLTGVEALFNDGRAPCLIASMTMAGAPPQVRDTLASTLADWLAAIVAMLVDTGATPESAHAAAGSAISQIEGALIIARALAAPDIFTQQVANARAGLMAA